MGLHIFENQEKSYVDVRLNRTSSIGKYIDAIDKMVNRSNYTKRSSIKLTLNIDKLRKLLLFLRLNSQITYKIIGLNGNEIKSAYYEQELLKYTQ